MILSKYYNLFIATLIITNITFAQDTYDLIKLIPNEREEASLFGVSVDVSGDFAVVGSPLATVLSPDTSEYLYEAGAVYIYHFNSTNKSWELIKKLLASDRDNYANFGLSVSLDNDILLVSSIDLCADEICDSAFGRVYVFEREEGSLVNWKEIKKIEVEDRKTMDQFGYSVSLSGDYAVVGSPGHDFDIETTDSLDESGAAYIFNKNKGGTDNWGLVKKLTAPERILGGLFGISTSIHNNIAVIGSLSMNADEYYGGAYIFELSNNEWSFTDTLKNPYAGCGCDNFGLSVATHSKSVIVGAAAQDKLLNDTSAIGAAGAAYVFKKEMNEWKFEEELTSSDPRESENFGASVSIYNNRVIIGAKNRTDTLDTENVKENFGAAYLFEYANENWNEVDLMTAQDKESGDQFGTSVAISEHFVMAGSPYNDYSLNGMNFIEDAGGAYIIQYKEKTTTSIGNNEGLLTDFNLFQNYPNPFNPSTRINYQIKENNFVTLKVFDSIGREVSTLINKEQPAGNYNIEFSAANLASGVYYYRLSVNDKSEVKKMILLR